MLKTLLQLYVFKQNLFPLFYVGSTVLPHIHGEYVTRYKLTSETVNSTEKLWFFSTQIPMIKFNL